MKYLYSKLVTLGSTVISAYHWLVTTPKDFSLKCVDTILCVMSSVKRLTQEISDFLNQTISFSTIPSLIFKSQLIKHCFIAYSIGFLVYKKLNIFSFFYTWIYRISFYVFLLPYSILGQIVRPHLVLAKYYLSWLAVNILQHYFECYKKSLVAVIRSKMLALDPKTPNLLNVYKVSILIVKKWELSFLRYDFAYRFKSYVKMYLSGCGINQEGLVTLRNLYHDFCLTGIQHTVPRGHRLLGHHRAFLDFDLQLGKAYEILKSFLGFNRHDRLIFLPDGALRSAAFPGTLNSPFMNLNLFNQLFSNSYRHLFLVGTGELALVAPIVIAGAPIGGISHDIPLMYFNLINELFNILSNLHLFPNIGIDNPPNLVDFVKAFITLDIGDSATRLYGLIDLIHAEYIQSHPELQAAVIGLNHTILGVVGIFLTYTQAFYSWLISCFEILFGCKLNLTESYEMRIMVLKSTLESFNLFLFHDNFCDEIINNSISQLLQITHREIPWIGNVTDSGSTGPFSCPGADLISAIDINMEPRSITESLVSNNNDLVVDSSHLVSSEELESSQKIIKDSLKQAGWKLAVGAFTGFLIAGFSIVSAILHNV